MSAIQDRVIGKLPTTASERPKFKLGRVLATPGALAALRADDGTDPALAMLAAHSLGQWGEVCDEDKALNDLALIDGDRLLSCYRAPTGERIWIITEWDRSVTTLLLPEEY